MARLFDCKGLRWVDVDVLDVKKPLWVHSDLCAVFCFYFWCKKTGSFRLTGRLVACPMSNANMEELVPSVGPMAFPKHGDLWIKYGKMTFHYVC